MKMSNLKKEKSRVQIEQQFIYLLINIIESYPQYSISEHLSHFLRKKRMKTNSLIIGLMNFCLKRLRIIMMN